jgi:phosphotransferase system  glucose/maltose/N-acetylglucosamine-specific IIC component
LWQEAAVPGLILAGVTPDNTPSGYYWTFLFPMLLFIVIAAVLYMLFSRPHRRVPGRRIASAAAGAAPSAEVAQATAAAGAESGGSADDAAQTGQAEHAEGSE